jgi:rRNA-processing protein FCF1
MVPGEFGVDIFEEIDRIVDRDYELITSEPVKWELQNISKNKGEEGKAAKIALMLMDKNSVEVYETSNKTGDASIIEVARGKEGPVIATNDKGLKKQFRERSIPVIYLRTKDHLELEGNLK